MVYWCEYKLMGAQQPGLALASRPNMLGLLGKYLCSRGPMFSIRDPGFNHMLTYYVYVHDFHSKCDGL